MIVVLSAQQRPSSALVQSGAMACPVCDGVLAKWGHGRISTVRWSGPHRDGSDRQPVASAQDSLPAELQVRRRRHHRGRNTLIHKAEWSRVRSYNVGSTGPSGDVVTSVQANRLTCNPGHTQRPPTISVAIAIEVFSASIVARYGRQSRSAGSRTGWPRKSKFRPSTTIHRDTPTDETRVASCVRSPAAPGACGRCWRPPQCCRSARVHSFDPDGIDLAWR